MTDDLAPPANGYRPRITDLPSTDRPRERLATDGAAVLNNNELLAILLRVGIEGENAVRMAERLLAQVGGLPGLHRASYADPSDRSELPSVSMRAATAGRAQPRSPAPEDPERPRARRDRGGLRARRGWQAVRGVLPHPPEAD